MLEKTMWEVGMKFFLWRELLSWFQTYRFGGGLWKASWFVSAPWSGQAILHGNGSSVSHGITWVSYSATQWLQSQDLKKSDHKKSCTRMFTAALLIIASKWKQSNSINWWIVFKKCGICPYKRLLLNENEVVTRATTWITLENTTLCVRSWL